MSFLSPEKMRPIPIDSLQEHQQRAATTARDPTAVTAVHRLQRHDRYHAAWKGPRMVSKPTHAAWFALTGAPLAPDRRVCDPHPRWDFQVTRVAPHALLAEILEDVQSGHNVVANMCI
jgi:hypothetical protein